MSFSVHTAPGAMRSCIALGVALLVLTGFTSTPAKAQNSKVPIVKVQTTKAQIRRQLAAELRIVRADVIRLNTRTLPSLHRKGLRQRITGALGVLPWLLRLNADAPGADAVRSWQQKPLDKAENRTRLVALLTRLTDAHRVDLAYFESQPDTAATRSEARAIHKAYCAQCHDGAGTGDPGLSRPARDLFTMMRAQDAGTSLALLINGIKGDAQMQFRNPLNDARLAALWRYYRSRPR